MVRSERNPARYRHGLRLTSVIILLAGIIILACPHRLLAQDDYPAFGLRLNGTQYIEISQNQHDVTVSQQIAQIVYRDPQFFWLSFGLGREEIDAPHLYEGQDIDEALCFQVAGAYYLAPNLELGIPADFSIGAEYSRARHDIGKDDRLTHQRLIGTANLEWDFHPATPYVRVGALYATLDASGWPDEDQTSALFIGGLRFSLTQGLSLGAEFNISQDIGFGGTIGYIF
ncbi:MAG: hypothetical protein AB1611_15305 [bacterium]